MVRQQQQEPSRAEVLQSQWRDFRTAGSPMYDSLIWSDMKWPALSLAWLPSSGWTQPAAVAAAEAAAQQQRLRDHQQHAAAHLRSGAAGTTGPARPQQEGSGSPSASPKGAGAGGSDDMDTDGAPGSSSGRKQQRQRGNDQPQQQQLLQMPVECHYLLTGTQTSRQGTAHVELYRVELPGQLPALQVQQRVLMQKGTMQCIMRISHGRLDVNRLAVMPQQPNILATCCDEAEVYLFDLRHHAVEEQQDADAGSEDMQDEPAEAADSSGGSDNEGSSREEDADSDDEAAGGSDDDSSTDLGSSQPPNPQAVLQGRAAGGDGLEFNPVHEGWLLGGDSQGGVQLWDVSNSSSEGSYAGAVALEPAVQAAERFAPCAINDLSWHRHGTAYALALESGEVWVQDMRIHASTAAGPSSRSSALTPSLGQVPLGPFTGPGARDPTKARVHVRRRRQLEQGGGVVQPLPQDCYCVAFDPLHDHRLASGGADGYIRVLDLRRMDQPVDELPMHAGSVTSLAWSHKLPGLLASAGADGAVLLWDANKLQHAAAFSRRQQQQGQQGLGLPEPRQIRSSNLTQEVQQYSLPGLLFLHGGHAGGVGAVALNPDRPWLAASASAGLVEAADSAGRSVVIQRQPVMVWEPNTSEGLLC